MNALEKFVKDVVFMPLKEQVKLQEQAAAELAKLQADNARLRLVESAAKKALPHIINCAHHHRDDYVLEEEVIPELESALNGDVS